MIRIEKEAKCGLSFIIFHPQLLFKFQPLFSEDASCRTLWRIGRKTREKSRTRRQKNVFGPIRDKL